MFTKIVDGRRPCISCGEEKPVSEFPAYSYTTRQGKPSVRHDSRCRSCNRVRRRERYLDPEKAKVAKAASLAWRERNKEHIRQYQKAKQQTPEYRALKAKAQRIRKARIRAGASNKDDAIAAIYKAAMDLEKKLAACVVCDDPLEIKIHVDHIVPLKHGGLHVVENLQLLSARENLTKGANPHFAMTGGSDA